MIMRSYILALAGLLVSAGSCPAAFGIFQTYAVPVVPQIACNLVTGAASVGGPCTSGATCDGVADDAPSFKAFNTWALANQGSSQVVLTIPNGATCFFSGGQAYPLVGIVNAWTSGIKNLIVEGAGASISSIGGTAFYIGGRWGCQAGLAAAGGCSARLQTVNPGDSTITLTADSLSAGYISRFTIGAVIMIGGFDVQGLFQVGFGYPPNNTYFEWRQITNVNAGTGVITLDSPVTGYYLSTWPTYNTGSNGEADAGGSATVWAMPSAWNVTQEFRGLTISQTGQINGAARNIIYRNVSFPGVSGNCGAFPSQAETWAAINTTWNGCVIEADKLVGTVTLDTVTMKLLQWQSNSIGRLVMSNSTITQAMQGGARDNQITDTSFASLRPGSYTYGNSFKFVCTRCAVTSYDPPPQGGVTSNLVPPSSGPAPYTMSGGIISWPVTFAQSIAQGWSSPIDVPIFFRTFGGGTNNYNSIGVFKVTGVSGGVWPAVDNQSSTTNVSMNCSTTPKKLTTAASIFSSGDVGKVILIPNARSGGLTLRSYITAFNSATDVDLYDSCTNTLSASSQTVQWGTAYVNVQTNQAGGFPTLTNLGNSYIQFASSQAPQFTCDACTGDPVLTAMNVQVGATPLAPLASYSQRTYATQAAGASIGTMAGTGKLVSLTVDITTAYTGSGAGTLLPTDQFHNYTVKQSDWTQYDWLPSINAKVAGTRVITPSGVTCNGSPGGCSGDTNMTVPEAVWVARGIAPSLALAGSGGVNPSFTITLQTDQTP